MLCFGKPQDEGNGGYRYLARFGQAFFETLE
jgi:hypothetical protein